MKTYLRFLLLPLFGMLGLLHNPESETIVDLTNNCYFLKNEVTEMYNVRENDTLTNEISIEEKTILDFYKDNQDILPKKEDAKKEEKKEETFEEIKEEEVVVEETHEIIEEPQKVIEAPNPNLDLASSIVNFAVQFVGNPYVYGGTSLTNGTDCSGFTQSVFSNFGISLPRSSADQANVGNWVSLDNIQVGDLVFYGYSGSVTHVALYIGNNQVVHALNPNEGIKITTYTLMPIITVRRVL